MSIENDPILLRDLMAEYETARPPWNITAYWKAYSDRMLGEIERNGLADALRNYRLLKGFATGGIPQVIGPADPLKQKIFFGIEKLPLVRKVIGEYQRLVHNQHIDTMRVQARLANLFFAQIQTESWICERPTDSERNISFGNPETTVNWGRVGVPLSLVPYISRAYDFYCEVDKQSVDSLIEIGPGLGFSTLSHRLLNQNIGLFVNIDIPTTLYISGQYLKSTGLFSCVDYKTLPKGKISLSDFPQDPTHPTLVSLPPWRAQDVEGSVSWSHNAFSFQEMEADVVQAYATVLKRCVRDGHWFLSSIQGHKAGAGGQKSPVDHGTIRAAFLGCEQSNPLVMKTSETFFGLDPRCGIIIKPPEPH